MTLDTSESQMQFILDRRSLLKKSGALAGGIGLGGLHPGMLFSQTTPAKAEIAPAITTPEVKELVFAAIQSARDAGAEYVEVRLSHTLYRDIRTQGFSDQQFVHASVSAFLGGHWGMATGYGWDKNSLVSLGKKAAIEVKEIASHSRGRTIQLSDLALPVPVQSEHWEMPVEIDPLSIHPLQLQDSLNSLAMQVRTSVSGSAQANAAIRGTIVVQERAFGSSENSYCTQKLYRTSGSMMISLRAQSGNRLTVQNRNLNTITPSGTGWELFSDKIVMDHVRNNFRDILDNMSITNNPVEIGKFNVAMDAKTVAALIGETIGAPAHIDSAMGFEVDNNIRSFLNNPKEMAGKYKLGSELLTVSANRSERGGAATVRWDDQGISPRDFNIVESGVFREYQTSNEGAAWLRKAGLSEHIKSNGCAIAPDASNRPRIHTPNLVMKHGAEPASYEDIVSSVENGYLIEEANISMSIDKSNGILTGRIYEIRNGKKTATVPNSAMMFNTADLWRSLKRIGGSDTSARYGFVSGKGNPYQQAFYSSTAVPAMFGNQTLFDTGKR